MKEIFLFSDNCGINKTEKSWKIPVTASESTEALHIFLMSDCCYNGTPQH